MQELSELRSNIDRIDDQILHLFIERMDISKDIGAYKQRHNMPIVDDEREKEILNIKTKMVENEEYIPYARTLFHTIMSLSKDLQLSKDSISTTSKK